MTEPEPPDVARLRAALASLAERPGWEPADAARIFAALHGEVSLEERRAVIEELVRNPAAAAAWRLARELAPESTAEKDASAGSSPPARSHRRRWTWASVAAAVLAAVALGTQLRPGRPAEEPTYRSVDQRRIESLVRSDTPLSRAQPVLRWTAVDGAKYRVRVLTPELELLDEAEDLGAAEFRLRADVLGRVPAGGRLLWQVEASSPGASTLVSPTFSSRLE